MTYKGRSGRVWDAGAMRFGRRAGSLWMIAIVIATVATGLLAGCRESSNTSGTGGPAATTPPPTAESKTPAITWTAASLSITDPKDGDKAIHSQVVRGIVSDPKAKVWVIVHPMLVANGFWVQNPVSVRSDGKWTAQVYLGVGPDTQVGELFELRAVADPHATLTEGDVLKTWPDGRCQSDIVEVERIKG